MKRILIIFLLALFAFTAKSQKSYFGVEAGVNIATQRVVTYSSYNPTQIAFHESAVKSAFSIYYQFEWTEKIAARVKASYMSLGFSGGYSDKYTLGKVDIDYLMVPVTLLYKANKNLSLMGGPYVSFTLGGSRPFDQDIFTTYHKNDFGISFGGEHDIYKGIALSVTYFMGLKNIWLNDQNGNIQYTNRALQIALSYKFKKQTTTSN